jgi:hypothetical protein
MILIHRCLCFLILCALAADVYGEAGVVLELPVLKVRCFLILIALT